MLASSASGSCPTVCSAQTVGDTGQSGATQPEPQTNPLHKPPMQSINLARKLETFSEHWQPRTVATFNGHDVMVVKVKGEFNWHEHANTDDFFLVLKGSIVIRMQEGDVTLGPGELFVVPKGAQHCPVAKEEAHLLLIEPTGTPNTGNAATAAGRRVV